MGGSTDRDCPSVKHLYSCGFEEPCRRLQCSFEACKVKVKSLISTGFLRVLPIISHIYGLFSDFAGKQPENGRSVGLFLTG
jgi:hypothetical protein